MSEKEEINIELEELESEVQQDKIGEVCYADTGPPSFITLKIRHRPDDLRVGQPLVIESDKYLYYSLIARLYHSDNVLAEKYANTPFTGLLPPPQIEGIRGKEFYGLADLMCLRLLPNKPREEMEYEEFIRGFDTIPPIFSIGREVTEKEIKLIYQVSEFSDAIGTLRGFRYEIPIDFQLLVEKPYGLFGRTGIGKSILNKILCLYILKHNISQLLLFDMQGEYGLVSRADNTKGLAFYFLDKIQIFRLSEVDKKVADGAEQFFIYKDNVTSSDIIASAQNLPEASVNTLYQIENLLRKGEIKFDSLLDAIENIEADELDINILTLRALKNRIVPFERYEFLEERKSTDRKDSLEHMFDKIMEGKSIVVDFAKYGINIHLYLFIANMITRRLYNIYSAKEDEGDLPPLVVVVEEAHKFLKSSVIRHTIFDKIARETRKFQLTMAIVDQRPSQIDEEVYSQIANTFVMHMTDDKDIKRVVQTLPDSKKWGGVISGLQKKQCFVRGDAVAVPSVVEVLDYKNEELLKNKLGLVKTTAEKIDEIKRKDLTILEDD
ncbi:MAG: ATP-binding protein [Promethearchaeota archaeon]